MHLAGNLSDLLILLWRGMIDCDATDAINSWDWAVLSDGTIWDTYGVSVHEAGSHLPGSFGTRPRNIAEKLTSGYKTWEFQLHMFGLGPILLYNILPDAYFANYCKLAQGFQIMCQHSITTESLVSAQSLLCQWEHGFKRLYYRYREDRIHFIRPCVHQVNHLATETLRKGPPICYAQWTMERTIRNLGQEIRQPSNPYSNLAQEGVRHCRVNSLLAAMPELGIPPKGLPDGAEDLGGGYVLLRKRERYLFSPPMQETQAIQTFLGLDPNQPAPHFKFRRWARLRLKNGQIARSAWRETLKAVHNLRVSRNVSFSHLAQTRFGEIQYFARLPYHVDNPAEDYDFHNIALLKLYSCPDQDLVNMSSQTVAACTLTNTLIVVDVKHINTVVVMIPRRMTLPSGVEEDCFCTLSQPGLDASVLGIAYDIFEDEDDRDAGGDVDE
ncbi:hypothetical protein PAXINDRAFT_90134 [Paxillus involutus ATCC 200175]|uniref:Uncharacterized protein n=1 Tax=Paxillus involutus ATCC 200175 TaxID=664439 RepID=A0A0C9SNB0_PAXIN|nr:hypothetical protein PAXINDRAFT_90134 [Paxillus involutus ATCC 200175]